MCKIGKVRGVHLLLFVISILFRATFFVSAQDFIAEKVTFFPAIDNIEDILNFEDKVTYERRQEAGYYFWHFTLLDGVMKQARPRLKNNFDFNKGEPKQIVIRIRKTGGDPNPQAHYLRVRKGSTWSYVIPSMPSSNLISGTWYDFVYDVSSDIISDQLVELYFNYHKSDPCDFDLGEIRIRYIPKELVDLTNSEIQILEEAPVSADGTSCFPIKVILKDKEKKPITDRNVTLQATNGCLVTPSIQKTNASGEAVFYLSSPTSFEKIDTKITALAIRYPDSEQEEVIAEKQLTFVGRLRTYDDGEPYSKIIEQKRILTPTISLDDFPEGKENYLPADGISKYEITLQLQGTPDTAVRRKVFLAPKEGDYSLDFPTREAISNEHGQVTFPIMLDKMLTEDLNVVFELKVLNDVARWEVPIDFIADDFSVYVLSVIPKDGEGNANIQESFQFIFNNPMELDQDAKITLSSQGEIQFEDSYSPDNWSVDGNKVYWKSNHLRNNIAYTAVLEGIKDCYGNQMKPYSWEFSGLDRISPAVRKINGLLDVEPVPFSIQVPLDQTFRITFTENLLVNDRSIPEGLQIKVADNNEVFLPIQNLIYTPSINEDGQLLSQVEFEVPNMKLNTQYTIEVSGGKDLANLLMQPEKWLFWTETTEEELLILDTIVDRDFNNNVFVDSSIRIIFNKQFLQNSGTVVLRKMGEENPQSVDGAINYWQSDGNTATGIVFTPTEPLLHETWYEIKLLNIQGADSGYLESYVFTFRTETFSQSELITIVGDYNLDFAVGPLENDNRRVLNITIPQGAVLEDGYLQVANLYENEKESLSQYIWFDGVLASGAIYQLTMNGREEFDFQKNIGLTIPYQENLSGEVQMLNETTVPASSLKMFFWDPQRKEWHPLNSIVNKVNKTVECAVSRCGIYGLLGIPQWGDKLLNNVFLTNNPMVFSDGQRQTTAVTFNLARASRVTILFYDREGKLVGKACDDISYGAGYNSFVWDGYVDGKRVRPGVYIYRLLVKAEEQPSEEMWVSGAVGVLR